MREIDFERFLIDTHADQYTGLDDEMPENFIEWYEDLSIDEVCKFANQYVVKCMGHSLQGARK